MIVSKRIKVPRGDAPADKLLEHMHDYLRNNAGGKVLRYAIVDVKGNDFIVDVSVRTDAAGNVQPTERKMGAARRAGGAGPSAAARKSRKGSARKSGKRR
ncbi:MAG: hypothetical protein QXU54_01100 [Candidatus Micrarchaeia archaeon]